MRVIRFSEPELRDEELLIGADDCDDTLATRYLPIPEQVPHVDFFKTLKERRTQRSFARLGEDSLSRLLWYTAKSHLVQRGRSGIVWQHRCPPSAGGKHPIDLLIIPPPQGSAAAFLYNPIAHAMREVKVSNDCVGAFHAQLQKLVPSGDGTIIWFVARYGRTMMKYENAESLVWRDAGVVLATMSYAAEALNLNCCAYGIVGDAFVADVFCDELVGGAGGCVVGQRIERR